jgi:hypothetical protein
MRARYASAICGCSAIVDGASISASSRSSESRSADLARQRLLELGKLPTTVGDRRDQPADGRLRVLQPPLQPRAWPSPIPHQPLALEVVLAHHQRHGLGRQQLGPQARQDAPLELGHLDRRLF